MIRRFFTLTAAASGLMLTVAVYAAEPMSPAAGPGPTPPTKSTAASPASPPAATPPAAAPATADAGPPGRVNQVRANGPPIVIEANKGTLIRLPRPASTVFIANPDVADVQIKSPLLIYVSAKAPGETVLYAVDSDDQVLLNAPVRVEHDLSRVRESLSAVAPGENVTVSSIDHSLALSGGVPGAGRAGTVRGLPPSIPSPPQSPVATPCP